MAWTANQSMLARMVEQHLNGATPPDPNKFYLVLTNGLIVTGTSTIAQIASAELPGTSGYARMSYNPSTGSYDGSQSRYEMPAVTTSITAVGAGLQYDTIVLISNANSTVQEAVGNVEFFASVGSATIPAGGTQSFVVSFNIGGNGVDVAAA